MQIRNAMESDFDRIMEIYASARKFMAENGNPNQWGPTNWPPEDLIHQDIKNQKSFVCDDNVVMQKLLEKLGFEKRGIIYVIEDNYPRIAYESDTDSYTYKDFAKMVLKQ